MIQKQNRPLLTAAEVSRLLGLNIKTVRFAIDTGQLPSVQIACRKLVPRAAVESLLAVPGTANEARDRVVEQLRAVLLGSAAA